VNASTVVIGFSGFESEAELESGARKRKRKEKD
jgi:hypothetical protein